MKRTILLLGLLASCSSIPRPDSMGPYIETTLPPGRMHDFIGVVGFEAQYGSTVIGVGWLHPDDGNDTTLFKFGTRL